MENALILGQVHSARFQRPRHYRFRHEVMPDLDRLIFVRHGGITVRWGPETVHADARSCVYLAAGVESVTEYTGEENDVILLWFERLRGEAEAPVKVYACTPAIMAQAETCAAMQSGGAPYRMMAAAYEILHQLSEVHENAHTSGVLHVVRYIEQNFAQDKKIAEYAAMAYMSESHFRKLFAQTTGKSPVAYRNERRLVVAEELIREGYTVAEAAETVGFGSVSFYCRLVAKRKKGGDGRVLEAEKK
ncbi:MAG: helix-turn-helix transcriptional regulator [Clostridia bacterium]|nr:helix-turn-helix transcriptional regulator [Clostridia bacterium]